MADISNYFDTKKLNKLNNFLIRLASNQEYFSEYGAIEECYKELEDIYYNNSNPNNPFRHMYSQIFSILSFIDKSEDKSLDVLAQNIEFLKNNYKPSILEDGKQIDISLSLFKLYDHVMLDICRLNYSRKGRNENESELAKLKIQIENEHKERLNREQESNKMKQDFINKTSDMQKEYITILGIFASIVLTFTGGITFSGAVLENIHKASIYRIILISLLIGLVLFNIISLLLKFLFEINNKKNTSKKNHIWIVGNVILLLLIISDFYAFKIDLFSKKEKIMESPNIEISVLEQSVK